jgi:tripartite-type tricarboxylate transporter receptor subunit TctC
MYIPVMTLGEAKSLTRSRLLGQHDACIAPPKSKPGLLTFGAGGIGTMSHLAGELFQAMADAQINHVTYELDP